MPGIKFDTIVETAKVVSGFRDIQNAIHQTAEKAEKEGKSIDDVISNIQNSLNIAIGGWSIGKFVNQMMQVRGQFQQTEMAFKTMLQSEEKADALMKQLIRTAAVTPFGVEDVTEGAKQLLAFNVAAEDVNKTLIGLGDVAAGMGINLKDLVMLYGTTIAKGKMDTMDLYQFLNRGIPIADEIAKVMGLDVTNAIKEVQKQIKAGKVTSDIFIQAMQSMTAEGSKFGGLMEAQSKTITGQISNIEDSIEQMFNELGKSQEGVINTGLGVVSTLVENWETVGKVLMTVVAAYGAYKAAVIAMIAIEKARIAIGSAQAFLSLARSISSAKEAMLLFNMATSANPLGLLLGTVAAGITLFSVFGGSAEDASTTTNKFGDDAAKASSRVESLLDVIKALGDKTNEQAKKSKAYKDAVNELSTIYSEYGITIDKIKEDESNLVDVKQQEIDKSNELIEQIKLESAERNRANAISQVNDDYNKKITEAQEDLLKNLKDAYGNEGRGISLKIQDLVSEEELKKLAQYRNDMRTLNKDTAEYNASLQGYLALRKKLADEAAKAAVGFGKQSDEARLEMTKYVDTMERARDEYNSQVSIINKAADATEDFGNKSTSTKDRINALQKQLQGAGEDVHVLYNRVKEFMQNYGVNNVDFKIRFDAEIPSWMNNMNVNELGKMGRWFSALARDLGNNNKSGAKVNGKWMSTKAIAQRGWDYTNAANTKQTKAEDDAKRKQREKEEAEANAKKNASKAKKQAEDRKKAQEKLNEDLKQLQQENIDNDISQMQEGTEKKIAEIKNDYAKRKAEIDKQEAEFKKKNKEAGKKVTLTSAQSNALNKARDLATQEYNKKLDEVNREALTSMRDYLKEYGSLYQQKQAIADEYEEKIAKAQTEGEKKTLQQEKKKALANFDYESISMGIDWKGLMSGVGNMSKEMLKPMLDKLDAYTNTPQFQQADSQTQQKVVDLMQEIRSYLGTDQKATWQNLAASIDSFNKSVVEYQNAVDKENKQNETYKSAKTLHDKGKMSDKEFQQIKKATDEASKAVVDAKDKMNTFGVMLNSATEAVTNYTSGLSAALNKLGTWKGNDGFSEVQSAVGNVDALKGALDESLSTMGDGVAKTIGTTISKGLGSTLGSIGSGITNMMGSALGSIVGVVAQIPKLILNLASSIKSFVTGILDSFTELLTFDWLSDLVNSILASVGNLIDAIFDLPENLFNALQSIVVNGVGGLLNTVVGRIGNVLSLGSLSSDGPASWFTNSNAAKVAKNIEKLNESNESLEKSIDRLKTSMDTEVGLRSIDSANEAKRLTQQKIDNKKQIAKEQASYHDAHKSFNKRWKGFTKEEIQKVSKSIGRDFNGDLWSLDQNEMSKMLGEQWFVNKIKGTGAKAYANSVLSKLEDYADTAGELEEIEEQLRENLTQISFDSMKDDFISNLMDMSKSAEDFADDFTEMLQRAMLSFSIEDLIYNEEDDGRDSLKKLHKDWAKILEETNGNPSQEQINTMKNRYTAITNQAIARRNATAQVTGYTGESSSQTATSGGWASMGQETADELNGRFTALQIAGESIAQNMTTTISQMESIVTLGISTNGAVLEIRNMMIMTNSYLEDIVKYSKLTYNDFGSKLDDMNRRLKEI